MKKNKEKDTTENKKYKPASFRRYRKLIYKSKTPEERKELYKEYTSSVKKEKTSKAKKKLYRPQRINKAVKQGLKSLTKVLPKKVETKRIIRPQRLTLNIKEKEPAPYVNRFFKDEWEEAKHSMFFK